jgi:hypothetical protein
MTVSPAGGAGVDFGYPVFYRQVFPKGIFKVHLNIAYVNFFQQFLFQ